MLDRPHAVTKGVDIRFRDPGWILTLAVGSVALIVASLVVVTRLTGTSERASIPTESWMWSADGVEVEPTTPDSPFRNGDLVTALNGRPLEAWIADLAPIGPDADETGGSAVVFDIIRGGQPDRLEVDLVPVTVGPLRQSSLLAAAFALGVLLLAVVLLVRRPRSPALRLLFVGATANLASVAAWETGIQPTDLASGSLLPILFVTAPIFNVLFWSTTVHILAIYPARSRAAGHSGVIALIHAGPIAALVIGAVVVFVGTDSLLVSVDRLANVVGVVTSAMVVAVLASVVAAYRRTPPAVRSSLRLVALTLVVAALATLALLTLPIAILGRPLVPRGTLDLLALPAPIALVIAVLRDRLFQVALLTRSRERVVAAREDERRKLRRDLHDGLAPSLAAVGLKLDAARQLVRSDPEQSERMIDDVRRDVRASIAEIRRLSRDLRPPALDSLGLIGALRQQADALVAGDGAGPAISIEGPPTLPVLSAAVEVAAYRIAVEGMMNAVRHSGATTCAIRIDVADGELLVEVADDGTGMLEHSSGVGTRSMLERAAEVGGDVRTEGRMPHGTAVIARLPVESPRETAPAS